MGTRTLVWRRRVVRGLLGTGALIAAVVVAALVLLRSLDRPWIKTRIQAIARTSGGVDVDYDSARLAWSSGLAIEGLVPDLRKLPPGCRFTDRCPMAIAACSEAEPELLPVEGEAAHLSRCIRAAEL